jgi:hypothetical protein
MQDLIECDIGGSRPTCFLLWNWRYIIIPNRRDEIIVPDLVTMIRCIVAQKPEPCNVLEPPGRASFKFECKNDQARGPRPDRPGRADRLSLKTPHLIVLWLFQGLDPGRTWGAREISDGPSYSGALHGFRSPTIPHLSSGEQKRTIPDFILAIVVVHSQTSTEGQCQFLLG